MSALPPKADIRQRIEHVCFVPEADIQAPCIAERTVGRHRKQGPDEVPAFSVERQLSEI